jgi:uncharacterized heparinase superfamily protein
LVLQKGPGRLLDIGRGYTNHFAQQAFRVWSPSATDIPAFLRQLGLAEVQAALSQRDRSAAQTNALRHFRTRTWPRLGGEPPLADSFLAAGARAETLTAAEAICRGEFRFRGQPPLSFPAGIDWFHEPDGNVDWRWDLNRHAYLATLGRAYAVTGETRYLETFRLLVLAWLARNPPGVTAPNWFSPLEVAYRLNVWIWAFELFRAALDAETLLACLRGLWLHGRYLAANLEYASPNNHLLLEAKALAMAGTLFPEFHEACRWQAVGLRIVDAEVQRQVSADGVHLEQSMLYHRVIASELLELLIVLKDNGVSAPAPVVEAFSRMLVFEQALTKPDGALPLIGDSTLTDSYLRYDALLGGAALLRRPDWLSGRQPDDATAWLLGPERLTWLYQLRARKNETIGSQSFPAGGYCVLRQADRYLVFDCGPVGYPPAPGHGHADALSFEVFADGHTWLVDPGVYSYHLGAQWRRYFKGTSAHNTVTVDEQDQTLLLDDWRLLHPPRVVLQNWYQSDRIDLAEATHAGYCRLAQGILHRRQVVFVKPDYWVIVDRLEGQGGHQFDLYFHGAPEVMLELDAERSWAHLSHADGANFWLCPAPQPDMKLSVITGSVDPIQGWVSQNSGEKQPAAVLRCTKVTTAPTQFVTVLLPGSAAPDGPIGVTSLTVLDEAGHPLGAQAVCGLHLATDEWRDLLVLDQRVAPSNKRFSEFETDARLTYLRWAAGETAPARCVTYAGQIRQITGSRPGRS